MKKNIENLYRQDFSFFVYISFYSDPDIAVEVNYATTRSSLFRSLGKSRPKIPDALEELDEILKKLELMTAIYRGMMTASDVLCNKILQLLKTVLEIYMDGTFKVRYFY